MANLGTINTGTEIASFFCLQAQEGSGLTATTYEWSWADGNTESGEGPAILVPSGYTCTCIGISGSIVGATPSVVVELELNGSLQGANYRLTLSSANYGTVMFGTPLAISDADQINLYTVSTSGGDTGPHTMVVWFKLTLT